MSAAAVINAAKAGNVADLAALLKSGESPDAIGEGYSALDWAVYDNKVEAARLLLDHGADINARGSSGVTPLMTAASRGHVESVRLLLDRGADRQLQNSSGQSALALVNKGSAVYALLSETPEEVIYFHPVADRVMQEVYSFTLRERITLLRKSEDGDVEAIQRERFEELKDKSALRRAFDEHRKRGGKLEESDVFADTIAKRPVLRAPSP